MIRPAELRKDWPWVKPLLQACIDKTQETWWPEDVYANVSNGRAAMYVSDEPEGVIVCYPDREAWTGEPTLHIWALWAVDGFATLSEQGYELLRGLAQKIGAKKLVMHSPRKGWERTGWQIEKHIYTREV